jgi:beta-phosphoglucomutase
MTNSKCAFLFDLNGTIIDDMDFHVKAWSKLLEENLGRKMSYDEVKAQMYGKNSELFERVFGKGFKSDEEIEALSYKKERIYQSIYKPHIKLIDGLGNFLERSYQLGIPMAMGTAAIMFNVNFTVDALDLRKYFKAYVSADDVHRSKPDPETYLICAEKLGVQPTDCIVFEDAPKGVESARNAGMKTVVILSHLHTRDEFAYLDNIICFVKSYDEIDPAALIQIC